MAANVERAEVEILDRTTNATVVRLPWRRFPGIVVQGDTLNGRRADLREAIDSLRAQDAASALNAREGIDEWLGDLLSRYEAALGAAGLDLPYAKD
jgi:hypothetical protein